METIYLDEQKTAWLEISKLSDDLILYATENFDTLFNLHPEKKGNVLVFNKDHQNPDWDEIECFRYCKSYLATPKFDNTVMKSYMFSGHNHDGINDPLPIEFQPFYEYMKNYNQVIVNWYEKDDYIPPHSDCDAHMVDNYNIGLINLSKSDRSFDLQSRNSNVVYNVALLHGTVIKMCGKTQQLYTHSVGKGIHEGDNRRIGISFRQF
jgi:alkylated DNA repair dioxygenase AlkB